MAFVTKEIRNHIAYITLNRPPVNALTHVYNCPVPVIGAVNGTASGAGFCIAAVCDVLVAAEGARFGLPEIKFGMLGGLAFTPWMVPQKLARYLTVTGNLIPTEKLEQYGSVHKIADRVEDVTVCTVLGPEDYPHLYDDRRQAVQRNRRRQ